MVWYMIQLVDPTVIDPLLHVLYVDLPINYWGIQCSTPQVRHFVRLQIAMLAEALVDGEGKHLLGIDICPFERLLWFESQVHELRG